MRKLSVILIAIILTACCLLAGCSLFSMYSDQLSGMGLGFLVPETDYTISFEANGGSAVEAVTVGSKSELGDLPTSTRQGYVFDGWYKDNGTFNDKLEKGVTVKEDLTVYAKWTASVNTISFNVNGGDAIAMISYSVEDPLENKLTSLPIPTWTGSANEFLGWYYDANLTRAVGGTVEINSQNITFYAKWRVVVAEDTYTVNYHANGGTASLSVDRVRKDTAITSPATATREGYNFVGWYTDDGSFLNQFDFTDAITENTDLYAKWTLIRSAFTVANRAPTGGTVAGTSDGNYDFGTDITLTATAADGYTFAYWYIGTAQITVNPYSFKMPANPVTVSAVFTGGAVLSYDKADSVSLTVRPTAISAANAIYGEGATPSDWSVSGGNIVLKAAFLKSLTAGYHTFLLKGSTDTEIIKVLISDTEAKPYGLYLNYDRAYPSVKVDFDCDCGGSHSVKLDGGSYENYTDQNFSLSKTAAHSLTVRCADGAESTLAVAAPTCASSYFNSSFSVNGETYDYYIDTVEAFGALMQYLIFLPYTEQTSGDYAVINSLRVAFGGEVKTMVSANRGQELLQSASKLTSSMMSSSSEYVSAGGDAFDVYVKITATPQSEYQSGMESKVLLDDRELLVSGDRASDYEDFAINSYTKTQLVHSILELDSLPFGVKPLFDNTASSLSAKAVYNAAKEVCRTYATDAMSDYDKAQVFYSWLAVNVTYDDYAVLLLNVQNAVSLTSSVSAARNAIIQNVMTKSPLYSVLSQAYNAATLAELKNIISAEADSISVLTATAEEQELLELNDALQAITALNTAKSAILDTLFKTAPLYSLLNPCYQQSTQLEIYNSLVKTLKKLRSFYLDGAFIDKIAVCDGIASAFRLMCSIEGIECIEVSGYAGESHAWNKVFIAGEWYLVDPTWAISGKYVSHKYLLIPDSQVLMEGRQEYNADGAISIDVVATGDNNYYDNTYLSADVNLNIDSVSELQKVVKYYRDNNMKTVEIYYDVSANTLTNQLRDTVLKNLGIYGSYSISNNGEGVYIIKLP